MHHIGYLLTEGFQVMGLATQSVFEYANQVVGHDFYRMHNYSVAGGEVTSSLGMRVNTTKAAATATIARSAAPAGRQRRSAIAPPVSTSVQAASALDATFESPNHAVASGCTRRRS